MNELLFLDAKISHLWKTIQLQIARLQVDDVSTTGSSLSPNWKQKIANNTISILFFHHFSQFVQQLWGGQIMQHQREKNDSD